MTLAAVSADVVALIIDGADDAAGLRGAVCSALTEAGCEPWRHMIEIFIHKTQSSAIPIQLPDISDRLFYITTEPGNCACDHKINFSRFAIFKQPFILLQLLCMFSTGYIDIKILV